MGDDKTEKATSYFGEVEKTSSELLKNTPSNIAILEDEIEHCKGRLKYLARTRSPSDGEDVRWYFCKVPLAEKQLSASIPQTEVVGRSDYFRFSVRDSLALEASFLQREEELLSCWWKEYAECSVGPNVSVKKLSAETAYKDDELFNDVEERVGVPVKGGLYEVDLTKRHCFPVYWHGENRRVLRGHWFARKGNLDWFPLREDVSEQLEMAYRSQIWRRRRFQLSGLFAARVDLQGTNQELHALFTGEDDTWEAWLVKGNTGFALNLGGGNGIKLRRGYSSSRSSNPSQDELRQQREEEMDDYCSQVPVGHLVFMIHGIGQRLEKANLVDDVGDFRRVTANLAERHLTPYQRCTQRVLFIPCQWRKGLKLSGESAVEKITLDGVRGLRVTLSATVHDVLYYMSPIYCQDIIDSVSNQLNCLYEKFLKRNPGYDGKVSIYAHSLGSVLSYDILCHQENLISPPPMDSVHVEHRDQNNMSKPYLVSEVNTDDQFPEIPPSTGNEEIIKQPSDEEQKNGTTFPLSSTSCGSFQDDAAMHTDILDKDKLISKLEEEVRRLKERVEQLEQIHACSTLIGNEGVERNEALVHNVHQASMSKPRNKDLLRKNYRPCIKYTKLGFKVDTFFAVGSPLGVFLSLRNIRIGIGRGQNYWQDEEINEEMPCCRQMFNIFHPFDPVAYRIEPLVCQEYTSKRPVIIPYHRGGKRLHIGFQEFKEDITAQSQAIASQLESVKDKVVSVFSSNQKDNMEGTEDNIQEKERTYGSLMMERLTGSEDGHVDYVLQEPTFQHQYISALGAHTNYWRCYDTALFILKHLYRDIPEDPPGESSDEESSKTKPIHAFYEKNSLDEDIPLTFSDRTIVREFSRKARKAMSSSSLL